ncbi:MAG: hypothetical protein GXO27_07475 [Chlorobi bacterium]|nr:hypothetical protein [Chlorobiota bacterium]
MRTLYLIWIWAFALSGCTRYEIVSDELLSAMPGWPDPGKMEMDVKISTNYYEFLYKDTLTVADTAGGLLFRYTKGRIFIPGLPAGGEEYEFGDPQPSAGLRYDVAWISYDPNEYYTDYPLLYSRDGSGFLKILGIAIDTAGRRVISGFFEANVYGDTLYGTIRRGMFRAYLP